jgi:poly(3-hydroxybutyrate) depolymerase
MDKSTGFSALADSEDFIVAYPDGHQRVWNANPAEPSSILGLLADAIAFISARIDPLVDRS